MNMNEHACAIVTNGHHTDIVLKPYSNRILLIVTHFKKFGTFLTIDRKASEHGHNDIFTIKTHFGTDNSDVDVAARYIAEQINIQKPLLLSIALKDYNVETLKAIVAAINQIKTW